MYVLSKPVLTRLNKLMNMNLLMKWSLELSLLTIMPMTKEGC